MEPIKIDRNTVRLMSGGKYLELNKTYQQESFQSFVDGALFIFDLLTSNNSKKDKISEPVLRQEITKEI